VDVGISSRLKGPPRWTGPVLAAGVVALALLLALAAWARRPEDRAWQRIQQRGLFVVTTDASYPPFAALDAHGNMFGFDIDLAEEIGRRWGVGVSFENITYDALLGTVIVGRNDAVISAFVAQPERTRDVAYTRSYFTGGTVAVIRAGDGRPMESDPLAWAAGQVLAVEYGTHGDALARHWARRAGGVTVLPQPVAAEALLALDNGLADAAVVDVLSAYDFMQAHPRLVITGARLDPEPYVIAVSVDSRVLLRELEIALVEMEADGTLAALRAKWFGPGAAE
jgi:polar amino acid transport system substrate-binding protein